MRMRAQYPRHAPSSVRQLFDPNRWIVVWAGDGAGGKESFSYGPAVTRMRTQYICPLTFRDVQ